MAGIHVARMWSYTADGADWSLIRSLVLREIGKDFLTQAFRLAGIKASRHGGMTQVGWHGPPWSGRGKRDLPTRCSNDIYRATNILRAVAGVAQAAEEDRKSTRL